MEECARTFGRQEVYYKGPLPTKIMAGIWRQEASNYSTKATKERRRLMSVEMKEFGEIQQRHALAMMKSGRASAPTLL